jgi:hypothetical protein
MLKQTHIQTILSAVIARLSIRSGLGAMILTYTSLMKDSNFRRSVGPNISNPFWEK